MFYFDISFVKDCQLYEGVYNGSSYGGINKLFDGVILGNFGNEYFDKRVLGDLLFLVKDCLVVYLIYYFMFVFGIFYLGKGVCVEIKLYDLLQVVVYILCV